MNKPPRIGNWILHRFFDRAVFDDIAGDLEELYFNRRQTHGRFISSVQYLKDVLLSARNVGMRKKNVTGTPRGLFQNYFKIGVRTLIKDKSYSLINILGLAVGIACTVLILLWVEYEYSFNHFASNYKRVCQVMTNFTYNGVVNTSEETSIPVYTALRSKDSRIKNTCITTNTYGHDIQFANKMAGKEAMAVSEEFLGMFGIPLVKGSAHSLDDPYSILLSESTAKEFFGDKDPVGQFITFDREAELKVTGVFKDVPENSSFWFQALVPISYWGKKDNYWETEKTKWGSFYPRTYVELFQKSASEEINPGIKNLVKDHFNDGSNPEMFLFPMDQWHLYDRFENGKVAGGKIEYVRLFTWIAILVLSIACINYTNLSTARSERRTKEVGIRKSVGSKRMELVLQFFMESFFMVGSAFVVAMLIAQLCLPFYDTLVQIQLVIPWLSGEFWIAVSVLLFLTGLVAGCYPALYFSSFKPVTVLKGKVRQGSGSGLFRRVLVTTQYVFAVFLILGMIVVYAQIQHVKSRELGYDQDNLACIPFNPDMEKHYAAIKDELLKSGVVEAVTKSNEGIDVDYFTDYVEWPGKQTPGIVQFSRISTEFDYSETNGIRLLQGRDFSPDHISDSSAVLVNETAVRIMGYSDPIGKTIKTRDGYRTIIGVLPDVLRGSPIDAIQPMYVGMMHDANNHMTLRLAKDHDLVVTMRTIKEIFRKIDPADSNVEPDFVNERFVRKFRDIERVGKLADLFGLLTVFLTGLGVLGLAAYTAEQRTKELAIRKVLGATAPNLLVLLSNYFVRIAIVAMVISTPISWWVLEKYLENYSYRISIPWWIVPVTSLIILVFTLVIVFSQVMKAAVSNPVTSLKSE